MAASTASAAPPDLGGKTLEQTFTELLPAIGKPDNNAQQRWQDICFAIGAPGNEKLRTEACTLMDAKLDAKTPKPARLWFLAQLQRIGNEESVEGIAGVLDDKDDEVREAAVRLNVRGGRHNLMDGPFTEAKEFVGGFFLLDCGTREQAVQLAGACPAAEWATIEVREVGPCYE